MQYKLYHKNRSMRQIVRQQMHLPHFDRFIALRVGDRCLMQPVLSSRNLDHRYLEVEFRRVKNEFEFKYFFRSSNIGTSNKAFEFEFVFGPSKFDSQIPTGLNSVKSALWLH